ncbi:IclR family transcriptional regulator domain-containing protein [Variovorax sp. RA8]|uniref:IclR family transcriptional regulator domain-containing protein n=1 Tax=Variovorax sp. (strain JCM 16519 / RA8) TaxID=662548 RepID=UPI000A7E50F5|nr:IclR family transcriptional regulator C-terminal domain-containing protein [Variovorax sp. RA8]VTU35175.1 Pca regulon regulatory protein [Variovorax sp. RA8]
MRGTERTLLVLRTLNQRNGSSVAEIAAATRISRQAIYRIFESLVADGYVRRRENPERYDLTALVRSLSEGYKEEDWMLQVASPVLERLQQQVVWPTDLAVFQDNAMYLRETTRRRSPMTIDGITVGTRLPMLLTATGKAYLAYCPAGERDLILSNLRASSAPEDAQAKQPRIINGVLAFTRRQGYGERRNEFVAKTSAIAVPLMLDERVIACLNITFIASVMTPKEAASRYLKLMKAAAAEISSAAQTTKLAGSTG